MNYAVIGAGAVGSFIGGLLKHAGRSVTFIARGSHLEAMKEEGLTVERDEQTFTVDREFSSDMHDISSADTWILGVKGTEMASIIEKVKPYVNKDTRIITLQNGVSNEEQLSEAFGKDKILPASAYLSAGIREPGKVAQHGPHKFHLGALDQDNNQLLENIVDEWKAAGISCVRSEDIMAKKWEKSLWNLTFNPLSAITGGKVSDLLDDPLLRNTCDSVLKEAALISEKKGYPVSEKTVRNVFKSAETVRKHKTSMLQDFEKGKPMEVYPLCGYFVEKSKELGIEAPVLTTLYNILEFINKENVEKNREGR
ncbi:ketopantoate reductase family protein [Bacillus sp. FJAT-44742]|uniref:ketopantoate reductase family protein n=1 Tax=Bacillus sp. FJAT-44742 TaxID=2014005 RepID=UPI000C24F7D5|nr:2-dehydropantoate 2-reductase [Bacillus sp. FJAT-44742]